MNRKFLGLIPARGGSKGLPRKNLLNLDGFPLVSYSIQASLDTGLIDLTAVSSEDDEILHVAAASGAHPIRRPLEFASDTSDSACVVTDALEQLARHGQYFDAVVLLQPTSPLRTACDVSNAIDIFNKSTHPDTCVISVYEPQHSPYKSFRISEEGNLEGLFGNQTPFQRRQDLPASYYPNGAIFIVPTDYFCHGHSFFSPHTKPYIMRPDVSIDIDTIDDLRIAESRLKTMNSISARKQ